MKSYFYLLIALLAFACAKKEGITISGIYTDPIDGAVKLELIVDNNLEVVDSFYLEPSGKFEFNVKVNSPGFYRLNFNERNIVNLILDKSDIQIIATDSDKGPKYKGVGSKDLEYLQSIATVNNAYQMQVQQLNEQFGQARGESDMETMNSLRNEFMTMQKQHIKNLKSSIWSMDNSIAGILAISYLEDPESQARFLDSLATKYETQLPGLSYTNNLRKQADSYKKLAIGSPAPEISLPDPSGKNISLSSLKGSYVLIDFWAAWCRPCRMENPNVVRMYKEYHDQGFEILGVSLDRKKEAWVEAIAQDNLTWNHVSDLQYFNSEAASDYNISAIPATYLIDPNGVIIGKNLRGPSLEAKLKEIFG